MLEEFAQTWRALGYPEIADCIHDFMSDDEETRERAYDILYDTDHPDSGSLIDNRYAVRKHLVTFFFYLFKESPYDKSEHLAAFSDMVQASYYWTQEEKESFEDLQASYIDYLGQFLDVPDWNYYVLEFFSRLPRYRERVAPIMLNFPDVKGIVPFYLAPLMVKPISNIDAYVNYFRTRWASESEPVRKIAEEALIKLIPEEFEQDCSTGL